MTESQFIQISEELFQQLEDELPEDLDCQVSGNVVTIENDDGDQVIVNRHIANQELWIAARSGGYHFAFKDDKWLSTRDDEEFFNVLNRVLDELLAD